MAAAETLTSLGEVDRQFQRLNCLGHGGFGSVFLAKKRSGRRVALKIMRIGLDDDEEEVHASFTREVDAVLKLDCTSDQGNNRDMGLVYFRDWFRGPDFACIVMEYANGGTLAQEIEAKKANGELYTERRIAWYALQLCEALAHAHSRGVAHHDVKSANVLVDRTSGGRLLLADFGSSVSPGEEGHGFTKIYAAPELQVAEDRDDFTGLESEKIDAFSLGCILMELICCRKLVDFDIEERTLGQLIAQEQSGAEAALNLEKPLNWLPIPTANAASGPPSKEGGYTYALGCLIKTFLEPNPKDRKAPSDLQKPLRQDPSSPLLSPYCSAARPLHPGEPVTIDNIQLGMFVQRGQDWEDGEKDGGLGGFGVVVKLDGDAGYTEVVWANSKNHEQELYRIGAGQKFEISVAPTPLVDFYLNNNEMRDGAMLYSTDSSQYHVGKMLNKNCIVVYVEHSRSFAMIAPLQKMSVPPLPSPLPLGPMRLVPDTDNPRRPMSIPITWNTELGLLVPLEDNSDEKQLILDAFFAPGGGMDISFVEIVSVHAIQSQPMWESYAACCEEVAVTNWGCPNEKRLFHGTGGQTPETFLNSTLNGFYQMCAFTTAGQGATEMSFSSDVKFGDFFSHRTTYGTKKIILSRVALGRVDDKCDANPPPPPPFQLEYHSMHKPVPSGDKLYTVRNPCQAYPEFMITYKNLQRPGRRVLRARRPDCSPPTRRVPTRPLPSPAAASSPSVPFFTTPPAQTRPVKMKSPIMSHQFPASSMSTPPARSAGQAATPNSAATKMCVVCMERDVCRILIPCGHPCLCEICSTKQGLAKLKKKCPECRQKFHQAVKFYGRVVED